MANFAKFQVGMHIKHPGSTVGNFPPGTGTIHTIDGPVNNQEFTYQIQDCKTGNVIPQIFKESQLEALSENDLKNAQQDEHARQLREGDNEKRQRGEETKPVSPDANRALGTGDEKYKEPTSG